MPPQPGPARLPPRRELLARPGPPSPHCSHQHRLTALGRCPPPLERAARPARGGASGAPGGPGSGGALTARSRVRENAARNAAPAERAGGEAGGWRRCQDTAVPGCGRGGGGGGAEQSGQGGWRGGPGCGSRSPGPRGRPHLSREKSAAGAEEEPRFARGGPSSARRSPGCPGAPGPAGPAVGRWWGRRSPGLARGAIPAPATSPCPGAERGASGISFPEA